MIISSTTTSIIQQFADLPFVLHIAVQLRPDRLEVTLNCEDGVTIREVWAYTELQQFSERILDIVMQKILVSVSHAQAKKWMALKPAHQEGYLAIMEEDEGVCWRQGLSYDRHGQPLLGWVRAFSPRAFLAFTEGAETSLSESPSMALSLRQEYSLTKYDPITRVAWYRRIA